MQPAQPNDGPLDRVDFQLSLPLAVLLILCFIYSASNGGGTAMSEVLSGQLVLSYIVLDAHRGLCKQKYTIWYKYTIWNWRDVYMYKHRGVKTHM